MTASNAAVPVEVLASYLRAERDRWNEESDKNESHGLGRPASVSLGRARECEAIAQHFGIALNSTVHASDKKCPAPEHAPDCGTAHDASLSCTEAGAAVTRDAQKEPQRYRLECTCTADPGRYVVTHGSNCQYYSKPEETPPVFASTVAKMHPDDQKTGLNTVREADGNPRPTPPCLFAVHGKGVCHLPHGHREDHWFGAPALSPRQALGEALACVERAQSLLANVPCGRYGADAYESVLVTAGVVRRAYEAAK